MSTVKCSKCGQEVEDDHVCSCDERKIEGFKKQGTCEVIGVINKEADDAQKVCGS